MSEAQPEYKHFKLTPHWRPKVHFTPNKNWMNDPNGMVYYAGKYHLFFQHNPYGNGWGNMSWGHATSTDLIHWQEQEVGIHPEPEGLGYIFSGSAVVDWNNTSSFQTGEHPPLIAIFTHHSEDGVQRQSIAYSNDAGDTWTKYAGNPVIDNPGIKDFRDPKVLWHEDTSQWVMVLAAGQVIAFYISKDLKQWHHLCDFGAEWGTHAGEWECPDLFPMLTDDKKEKWVLLVSLNPGGPNGGSATQYFVGEFNGKEFLPEHSDVKWLDYGPDNYAGVTWDGLQGVDRRRVLIGWMSNWTYAGETPTFPWRGAMTIPRELKLIEGNDGYLLTNKPVREFLDASQLIDSASHAGEVSLPLNESNNKNQWSNEAFRIEFDSDALPQDKVLMTFENDAGEILVLKYLPSLNKLMLDRRSAGWDIKIWTMPQIEAFLHGANKEAVSGEIILDTSSIEIFWGDGTTCITAALFPTKPFNKVTLASPGQANNSLQVSKIETNESEV